MLERWINRQKIPAIHTMDMVDILKELGIYDRISRGEIKCPICGSMITIDSAQCIYMEENEVKICCNASKCCEKVIGKSKIT
jgi:hypothetical protein